MLEYGRDAHRIEQTAHGGKLRLARGGVLHELSRTDAEHERRIRHRADDRGICAERRLDLRKRNACGNRQNKRLFALAFGELRQHLGKVLRLDRQQHSIARGVDLGEVAGHGVALRPVRRTLFLAAVEQQHLVRTEQTGPYRTGGDGLAHAACSENAETVSFHIHAHSL